LSWGEVSKYLADETVQVFQIEKHIRVVHNFFDENPRVVEAILENVQVKGGQIKS